MDEGSGTAPVAWLGEMMENELREVALSMTSEPINSRCGATRRLIVAVVVCSCTMFGKTEV